MTTNATCLAARSRRIVFELDVAAFNTSSPIERDSASRMCEIFSVLAFHAADEHRNAEHKQQLPAFGRQPHKAISLLD